MNSYLDCNFSTASDVSCSLFVERMSGLWYSKQAIHEEEVVVIVYSHTITVTVHRPEQSAKFEQALHP